MIAAKFGDPVVGVDIHMVMVPTPGGPVPTPLPHPFVGVVFDPLGAAIGAAMSAVFGGGGFVAVNGMPTGNTGTEVKGYPHIPTPPGVGPAPMDAPTGNEGTLMTGSKTVEFAGSSQSRTTSSVMSCNYPINLPTSVCMAVPMGAPVLIGGPEAIDYAAAATQAIRTKWVSSKLNELFKTGGKGPLSWVICALTGHPVDVISGELIAQAVDAELPGLIPLVFERNYRSREAESQSLGPGWYHFFDAYVEARADRTELRLPDGRPAHLPPIAVGATHFHMQDRLSLQRERGEYRVTDQEGLTQVFRPTEPARSDVPTRHRLIELRDRAGNTVTLTWQGRYLAKVIDTAGREIICRYTREGQLEKLLVLEAGKEHLLASYAYDSDGRLARAADPLGHAMTYAYRGGVLVREVHKGGLTFHFEWDWYDPEGWCIRTWGDAGDSDPACMDLAPGGRAPKAIYDRRITYDKHGHRTMVTDGRGGITTYEGNALGVVEKEIDPTGRVTKTEWNDHAWKLAEENGNGERTEWQYDARGNKTREIDALGQETQWTYDALDRVVAVTDPRGAVTRVEYDTSGEARSVTRADGTAVLYWRDERGRLVGVDDPMGRRIGLQWTPRHDLESLTDGEGRVTRYVHDALGSVVRVQDPLGRELVALRDAAGQPTFVRRFDGDELTLAYDAEGNLVEQTDARGRKVRMRYAGMGELVEHTDPMGHRVLLRYDEETDLVAVQNQQGDEYAFSLDRMGRVVEEKSFSGAKRRYLYDRAGRASQVLTGGYRLTKLERDALGRVVKQTSKTATFGDVAREDTFAFDEVGELIAARTPGADIVLERDALGRVVKEHAAVHATGLKAHVASRYDAADLRVERTTSMAHHAKYLWNNASELTSVAAGWALGPDMGLLRALGLPQASQEDFAIKIARDALGQELARRMPGGVTSVWKRDRFGRAEEQRVLTGASSQSAGHDVAVRAYAWSGPDEIARIASLDPASGVVKQSSGYEYDPRGHLIRQLFSSGEVLERASDAAGNLFRSADQSDRVYGKGGVLRKAGGTTYETDADGYLVKKVLSDGATWKYTWDAHGRLNEVARPDGKRVTFAYDAFGRRVWKMFEGRTTEYVWDGDDLVHERVRAADGSIESAVVTWVSEPGAFTPLAKLEGRKRWGVVTDHLGTPTMLATEAGKIAWQAQLDVYGVVREESVAAAASDAAPESERTSNPWRYPGQYEDAETGLYYNRFRYYDPETGRYLSEDPIGLAGGLAQYGYVENPTDWFDPFGLKKCKVNKGARERLASTKPKIPGNWHMHHIVMEGKFSRWTKANRKYVTGARAILKKFGVSLQGDANVVWAKNEKHSVEYAKKVYESLAKAKSKRGVDKVLKDFADRLGPGGPGL